MPGPGTYFHESNIFITEILGEFFLPVLLWAIKPRNAIILNGIIHYYGCSDWAATCALSSMTNIATEITFIDKYFNGSVLVQAIWKRYGGGSKGGGAKQVRPRSSFFHFDVVFGKTLPNNRLAHPSLGFAPLTGKSWIRHWKPITVLHIYFYCVLARMFALVRTVLLQSNKLYMILLILLSTGTITRYCNWNNLRWEK